MSCVLSSPRVDEWQKVEKDQSIPPGLHVQMNLQTGERQARLMEEQVGISTLSEKRRAKLDIMKPFLESGITDGLASLSGESTPLVDLSNEV